MRKPNLNSLTVSCVTYGPDLKVLEKVLRDLIYACSRAKVELQAIYLVDNGPGENIRLSLKELNDKIGCSDEGGLIKVISGHGNVGYGRGHNLALALTNADLHLVLNPDVFVDPDAIRCGIAFLEKQPETGMVVPVGRDMQGREQYLAKSYPDLLTLAIRAFCPRGLQHYFAQRLNRYELKDLPGRLEQPVNVPLASGCFMLVRRPLLQSLQGFDERFFMYFEDYDLSMRISQVAQIMQLPDMRIVHLGGGAARKGLLHIRYFLCSAVRFFSRYGWKFI